MCNKCNSVDPCYCGGPKHTVCIPVVCVCRQSNYPYPVRNPCLARHSCPCLPRGWSLA